MDKSEQILEMIAKINTEMKEGFKEVYSIMQGGFESVNSEIKVMKSDIKDIQMTLENETNKNIKIIAECIVI